MTISERALFAIIGFGIGIMWCSLGIWPT